MSIFVQIAAYRDAQLIPTIQDLLKKAQHPERLRIGICRQYHPQDQFDILDRYKKDARFRIVDIPYFKSRGACWARNITQRLYMGEDYTLQIDSHMRFLPHWDTVLINMIRFLQSRGYAKPLLTGYMAAFDPYKNPTTLRTDEPPLYMAFDRFTPEGVLVFRSELIPGWRQLNSPIPARFYSAGFCFTLGSFCREVQHDPEFYFLGEEISITVRAYTNGYDLFHPNRTICWHYYGRKKSRRQWDDDQTWTDKDKKSLKKNRLLLGIEQNNKINFGKYGLGTIRSLRDYEKYAGVLFAKKAVQQYTLDKLMPPNPTPYGTETQWLNSFLVSRRYQINIPANHIKEKDCDFWVIAFHDDKDATIFREDALLEEVRNLTSGNPAMYKIIRDFYAHKQINYWVVWPHSVSKGWCKRLTGKIQKS